jgi:translation initiation factor IF-2
MEGRMKTLTELSGSLVRMAAAAVAEVRRSLPKEEEKPFTPAVVVAASAEPALAAAPEAAPGTEPTPLADPLEVAPPAEEGAEAVAPGETAEAAALTPAVPAKKSGDEAESETVKALLDDAVAKATGCTGDRLGMLRAAVTIVGRRAGDVRLVRVFGVEEPLRGAQTVGEHQYVVDYLPSNMKQVADAHKDEKGRGKGRGGGRGGGGGDRGAKGAATGGFSMDSLRDDRKNERSGGGRPGGGGPRKPGGPGGRPPGGPPKK